jgi:predicted AAA+ superfamily ATPase
LDTGLCCYLTKWSDPATLQQGAMSGAILETYIFAEILKSYWHNAIMPNFYYYRDDDQKEIDLIIETAQSLHPVEFKKSATPSLSSIKNFSALHKFNKEVGHGAIICLTDKIMPLNNEVTAIPVGLL